MAMSLIANLSGVTGRVERRGARVAAPDLDVYYSLGLEQKRARIKNISPTGVFLLTDDRWPPDSIVPLVLQNRSPIAKDSDVQVRIPAKVVRDGDDGVGMEFVLESISTAQWLALFSNAVSLALDNDPGRVFRTAKAFAFLLRISPVSEMRLVNVIAKGMNGERAESAINIILNAENLLVSQNLVPRKDVPTLLLQQILEHGSRNPDVQMQQYWAGMLASTCSDGPESHASAGFVSLLSELAPVHIRILDMAGSRAIEAGWEPGSIFAERVHCIDKEIKEIAGVEDLAESESALDDLDRLGLLEMTVKCGGDERINLTPTILGLKFYARCSGRAVQLTHAKSAQLQTVS
jgi:hypothetical protein